MFGYSPGTSHWTEPPPAASLEAATFTGGQEGMVEATSVYPVAPPTRAQPAFTQYPAGLLIYTQEHPSRVYEKTHNFDKQGENIFSSGLIFSSRLSKVNTGIRFVH